MYYFFELLSWGFMAGNMAQSLESYRPRVPKMPDEERSVSLGFQVA